MSNIKNIIIFIVAAVILVLVYIFLIKKAPEEGALVSTPSTTTGSSDVSSSVDSGDFLNVLLSIKSIKLDDSIFADPAFGTLHDSSITLTPDGNEGRPNPFAPIGSDLSASAVSSPVSAQSSVINNNNVNATNNTTPVAPSIPTTLNSKTN